MPMIPTEILANDIIGQAVTIAKVDDSETLQASYLRMFYNLSINDIYNLLLIFDRQSLVNTLSADVIDGQKTRHKIIELRNQTEDFTNFDIIYDVNISNDTTFYDTSEIPAKVFNTAKVISTGLVYPYTTTILYSIFGDEIHILFGQGISTSKIGLVSYTIDFIKKPTLADKDNIATLYAEIPGNYTPLLVTRISAYMEYMRGISDKSLAVFNQTIENMMLNLKTRQALAGEQIKKELDYNMKKSLEV